MSVALLCVSEAQPSKTSHFLSASNAQPNKVWTFVVVFEGSTQRSIVVSLFAFVFEIAIERISFEPSFSKAQPSIV